MKLLAKSFEDSSCAAARVGPKILSPASRKRSTTPAASGASGPTTVSWIFSFFANATSSSISEAATFSTPASVAVPPLPGATNTFCTRGLAASFHASACSRPPLPMTRTFISVTEVPHAGEHHGDAMLVGRLDHLVVAQAAARLDHRLRTRLRERVEAVAEGKEGIRRHSRAGERELRALRLECGD